MKGYGFASALVWDGTLYVFAGRDTGEPHTRDVNMSKTDDLVNWSEPRKLVVPDNPDEYVYNQSVCYDGRRFAMAYEIPNGPACTPCNPYTTRFATSDDLGTWTKLPEAIYGTHRFAGCPALRYAGGYYYMLYATDLPPRHWFETWLTRSKDLVHWEDAPHKPVIAPDPTRNVHPDCPPHSDSHCPANGKEINASDPDLVEWQGKVRVYFTGGCQHWGGDLQYAEFGGTMQEFFESYYS
jgi:alpha-L-fucosidase